MNNALNQIANFMLIACAIGAVIAIRFQFVRRDYRKPNASAQQAGTLPPKAFYCNVPACPNYAPSDSAKALTQRPSHACRHQQLAASHLQRPTTRQRERVPLDSARRSHP